MDTVYALNNPGLEDDNVSTPYKELSMAGLLMVGRPGYANAV
jgi:hypothetical protein